MQHKLLKTHQLRKLRYFIEELQSLISKLLANECF